MNSKQIIIDYQEYLAMESELDSLRKPAEGSELSEAEWQEATGTLLLRCLENPDLFRRATGPVNLGKYNAIFVIKSNANSRPDARVKFERT